jgi:hypothetical protein
MTRHSLRGELSHRPAGGHRSPLHVEAMRQDRRAYWFVQANFRRINPGSQQQVPVNPRMLDKPTDSNRARDAPAEESAGRQSLSREEVG